MELLVVIAVVVILLVLGIVFEGRRQSRRLGRASGRPNLIGVGALELQRMLQPDRKVEILIEQAKTEDRVDADHRPGEAGERGDDDDVLG